MNTTLRSVTTRILHLSLLLAVLHQLLGSLVMEGPTPGAPVDAFFSLHEFGGLTSFGFVSLFWVWTLVRRNETSLGALIPWFSPVRLTSVWGDLKLHVRALLDLRLPDDDRGALASAVHGLGLLTVSMMAVTGTFSLVVSPELATGVIAVHKTVANFMWAYIIAHASLAVMHQLNGRAVLRQMFLFKSKSHPGLRGAGS